MLKKIFNLKKNLFFISLMFLNYALVKAETDKVFSLNMGKYEYKIKQLEAKRKNREFFKEERPKIRKRLEELRELENLFLTEKNEERKKRITFLEKKLEEYQTKQNDNKEQLKKIEDSLKSFKDDDLKDKTHSENFSNLSTRKKDLEKELKDLDSLYSALTNEKEALSKLDCEKAKQLLADVLEEKKECEIELKYINTELLGGNIGDIIFRGIMGPKNLDMADDIKFGNDVPGAMWGGLVGRASVSTGNAIGGIIDRYVQALFDSTLGKFEGFLSFLYRAVFHSACRPFTVEELSYWRKLVGDDFREIEMMIKNAEKLDSRSKADILREYENEQEQEVQTLNLWQDFVEDHAFTYEELAQEIELRKGYYKKESKGFGVVNCADRLINKLLKIRRWLLSVKSLRDFANIPEAKSIIPAMKRSIDNYFVNLSNQVKPLDVKKTTKFDFGENNYSKKDHWGNDFGEGSSYPGYMTE